MDSKYDPFTNSSEQQEPAKAIKEKHQKKLSERMGFGKYKESTVRWVIENDVDYMQWCVENIEWFALDQEANDHYEDEKFDFDDSGDLWHPGHPSNYGDR